MDESITLRRLSVFCLVVDAGGVTRAAEQLLVAQPSVSGQLRSLERSLGATLFVRSGGGLVLTEAGERVYQWAKEVLASSVQVQRDVDDLVAGTAGSLVAAASMAIGTYLLPPVMTALRAERTGADITVQISEPEIALRATQRGTVDLAVTSWIEGEMPDALVGEKLWEEPIVVCASPNGPPHSDSVTLAELAGLPLVGVPTGVSYHRMLVEQLRAHGVPELPAVIRLGHAEAIKEAVAANGWVSLSVGYTMRADLASGRLRAVRIRDAHLVEGIGLYHREAKYFSPLQSAAIEALRELGRSRRAVTRGP
ncbi:LysR family transcriptional regulator [Pseudonocardia halophobica]|uniref:LysR family transcriptional regulator n=1 Tax=Pseudonocardia halophobica TaxID=29401 RepID=UPI003D92D01F